MLDRDELEQALRASGAASGSLAGIDARPIGIGAMADTFLVRLRWAAGATGPSSLVAKLPSVDPQAARTAASLGAYEREARFYAELAPSTGLSLSAHYGTLGDCGLLLEDLSGLEPGDQFTDMPIDRLRQARQQLVALQAPFWDDPRTAGLDWLHRRQGVPIAGIVERMERSWAVAADRLTGDFDPAEREVIDRFVGGAGAWAESLDGPFSLSHHDFRADNLLIGGGRLVVLDWQTVGWGAPMFDVAYLLGTSVGPETRRAVERDEIRRHVEELDVGWSEDDAWQAYRRASWAVLLMLVPPTGSVKGSERLDRMFRRLLRQGARIALDLEAQEFLP
jgi:Phosphotransferase enzyme family